MHKRRKMRPNLRQPAGPAEVLRECVHWHIQALDTRTLFAATDFSIWLLQACMTTPYICSRMSCGKGRILPVSQADRPYHCHLNLTLHGDTKPSMWRDVSCSRTSF